MKVSLSLSEAGSGTPKALRTSEGGSSSGALLLFPVHQPSPIADTVYPPQLPSSRGSEPDLPLCRPGLHVMHLAVRTKGHPVQVLSHGGMSLITHDLEAVDLEGQIVPARNPIEQSFRVVTHRGAVAPLVVRPHRMEVVGAQRHDGVEVFLQECLA